MKIDMNAEIWVLGSLWVVLGVALFLVFYRLV